MPLNIGINVSKNSPSDGLHDQNSYEMHDTDQSNQFGRPLFSTDHEIVRELGSKDEDKTENPEELNDFEI